MPPSQLSYACRIHIDTLCHRLACRRRNLRRYYWDDDDGSGNSDGESIDTAIKALATLIPSPSHGTVARLGGYLSMHASHRDGFDKAESEGVLEERKKRRRDREKSDAWDSVLYCVMGETTLLAQLFLLPLSGHEESFRYMSHIKMPRCSQLVSTTKSHFFYCTVKCTRPSPSLVIFPLKSK